MLDRYKSYNLIMHIFTRTHELRAQVNFRKCATVHSYLTVLGIRIQPQRDCSRRTDLFRKFGYGIWATRESSLLSLPFPILRSANACVAVRSKVDGISRCNSLPISRLLRRYCYNLYSVRRVSYIIDLRGPNVVDDETGTICAEESSRDIPPSPFSGEGGSFQVYETLVKLAAWKRARQEAKAFLARMRPEEARDRAKFQIPRPH